MERKVYPSWAFKENEREKQKINMEIYKELCIKYKICRFPYKWNKETACMEEVNIEGYDIVLERTAGYSHSTYTVLKNNTDLSDDEMALICDNGNLCFGYTMKGKNYYIFED